MARLPRLALGGEAHLVLHRGHNGQRIVVDDEDRARLLELLNDGRRREGVAIHAYALLDDRLWLLATPPNDRALGRLMQSIGRRHTGAFNARHARSGTLWDGRFRSAIVEPGAATLRAMLFIERAAPGSEPGAPITYRWSSAASHAGLARDDMISDARAYWDLGNTPFEREQRYAALLAVAQPQDDQVIAAAVRGGWVYGSSVFKDCLQQMTSRRVSARNKGRPRRQVTA